jgi:hypothetical protein
MSKSRQHLAYSTTSDPAEILQAIERYPLDVTPVIERGKATHWSVGLRQVNRQGTNFQQHRIVEATSLAEGVRAWLDVYGPDRVLPFGVGSVVEHRIQWGMGPARVLAVGKWCAIVYFQDRVPSLATLGSLRPSAAPSPTGWETISAEEIRGLDCDDPDASCL